MISFSAKEFSKKWKYTSSQVNVVSSNMAANQSLLRWMAEQFYNIENWSWKEQFFS